MLKGSKKHAFNVNASKNSIVRDTVKVVWLILVLMLVRYVDIGSIVDIPAEIPGSRLQPAASRP